VFVYAINNFNIYFPINKSASIKEGTPVYIPPLTYIVNKKIIKNPNEFSG